MNQEASNVQRPDVPVQARRQEPAQPERARARRTVVPHVDIFENGASIQVLADMPGVPAANVDITIEKNVLTITGSVDAVSPEGHSLTYSEYASGDFQRVFTLPSEIDRERIEASLKNGVLKLTLPKAPAAQTRKIEVRSAS